LRPYCRIRLDLSLEYYARNYSASARYNLDEACAYLGCLDGRTARRHLTDIHTAIQEINLGLKEVLAHKSGFFHARNLAPDTPPAASLESLLEQVKEYHIMLDGICPEVNPLPPSCLGVVQGFFYGIEISTTFVSVGSKTHDTS